MIRDVAGMTMPEFAEAIARGAWILLPIGATEEHGPHLPLGSDLIQAEHVCREVAREVDGLVAPGIPYGVCGTTRNFPGTISLRPATLEALAREILGGYVGKGARRIAVISGHAGGAHLEALRQAALSLVARSEGLTILLIGPYDVAPPVMAEGPPVAADGHAGCAETSVMLAIAPDLVRTDRVPGAGGARLPRLQILAHPERLFPSGVRGDASRASRAVGEQVLGHAAAEILRVLREAAPAASAAGEGSRG